LGYISVAESLSISATIFTLCTPNSADFAETTQNNRHYAVHSHQFWYQSKAHMRLLVINLPHILHRF